VGLEWAPTLTLHTHHHNTVPDFLTTKKLLIDDVMTYVQVWDTSTLRHFYLPHLCNSNCDIDGGAVGQERFDSLGRSYYRNTNVCILVYDITNPRSLERLEHWKRMYEEAMSEQADVDHTVFGVFANKVSLLCVVVM
jgi:Ras-related protein Rab-7A